MDLGDMPHGFIAQWVNSAPSLMCKDCGKMWTDRVHRPYKVLVEEPVMPV